MKRAISLLLVLIMCLMHIPSAVFAASTENVKIAADYDGDGKTDFTYTINGVIKHEKMKMADVPEFYDQGELGLKNMAGKELDVYTINTGSKIDCSGAYKNYFALMKYENGRFNMAVEEENWWKDIIRFVFKIDTVILENGISYQIYAEGAYLQFLKEGYYLFAALPYVPQLYKPITNSNSRAQLIEENVYKYNAVVLHVISDSAQPHKLPLTNVVDLILDKIILPNMSQEEKVRTCYDFLINQYVHTDEKPNPNMKKVELPYVAPLNSTNLNNFIIDAAGDEIIPTKASIEDTIFEISNYIYDAYVLFSTGESGCKGFAYAFYAMLNRLGIEAELWYGNYKNQSGEKLPHAWNRVKVDGTWYWYDVDVEGTTHRRNPKNPYFLYKKDNDSFAKNHADGELSFSSRAEWYARKPSSPVPTALMPTVISMTLDGSTVTAEVPPFIDNGRTMVRVRFISEALGAKVDWDGKTRLVTVTAKDNSLIKLTIGNTIMTIEKNGQMETVTMDVPAQIVNDRTYVPVRYVAEALGLKVGWKDATRTVIFTTQ